MQLYCIDGCKEHTYFAFLQCYFVITYFWLVSFSILLFLISRYVYLLRFMRHCIGNKFWISSPLINNFLLFNRWQSMMRLTYKLWRWIMQVYKEVLLVTDTYSILLYLWQLIHTTLSTECSDFFLFFFIYGLFPLKWDRCYWWVSSIVGCIHSQVFQSQIFLKYLILQPKMS